MHPTTAEQLRDEDVAMIQNLKTVYGSLKKHMTAMNAELNARHSRYGEHSDRYAAFYDVHEAFISLQDEMGDVLSYL